MRVTLEANSNKELKEKIKEYKKEYPTNPYFTTIRREWEKDGKFFADIYRSHTCD